MKKPKVLDPSLFSSKIYEINSSELIIKKKENENTTNDNVQGNEVLPTKEKEIFTPKDNKIDNSNKIKDEKTPTQGFNCCPFSKTSTFHELSSNKQETSLIKINDRKDVDVPIPLDEYNQISEAVIDIDK